MAREHAVVCALPYSLSRHEPFNVSLFLSPTIVAPEETRLESWPLFSDWGSIAPTLRIEISDQIGVIECEAKLSKIDPALWSAMFPGNLPVRSFEVPDWSARKWASFSAKRVHDISLALHMATILSDPANPPAPSDHPLSRAITELAREFGCFQARGPRGDRRFVYREGPATERLDRLVESREPLRNIQRAISGRPWLEQVVLELHRCRRFYERPEAQWRYQQDPTPGAKPPALPSNEPEFHSRCAALGDHPELMRLLGLVIDVSADPDRLRRSKWLSAALFLNGDEPVSRATRVWCQSSGDVFTSVPRGEDWSAGALRLGDEERFSVLSLDTDGSALKADRFLWTLPRLISIQQNGDPVDAASPAQRSPGFTVARTDRAADTQDDVARQGSISAKLDGGSVPELQSEDVMRGMRVDVWDDESKLWRSLHWRRSSAFVKDREDSAYSDHEEEGFIQGTTAHENFRSADAPVQVHEAVFGWEGWSLSAPRPGKRIFEKDGQAELLNEQKAPSDKAPFSIVTQVLPGTLPRLRYGRSYSFRAWGVDLAGNSRPRSLEAIPATPIDPTTPGLTSDAAAPPSSSLVSQLILAARSATMERAQRHLQASLRQAADASALNETDIVSPDIIAHLKARRADNLAKSVLTGGSQRSARLSAALAEGMSQVELGDWSTASQASSSQIADVLGAHLGGLVKEAGNEHLVTSALKTITSPKPFLRWEPVQSPAIVPRWRYTEGESLRVLVVRSGVTQDPDTLAITIEPPDAFATTTAAKVPDCGYRATSERHLAPPKITQMQAELHGMFDLAIGSGTATDRRKMLGWALRADGTFADRQRADIDNPPAMVWQPGMSVVHVGSPRTNLKALPPGEGEPSPDVDAKRIENGEPPAPGQTIIHDVDDLALPYLPDPMADGIAFHFPQAGLGWGLSFPYAGEGFTVAFRGDWPELEPFRLVLTGGESLSSSVQGRVVEMQLPAGDIQLVRASSSLARTKLGLMGPWHFLPDAVRNQAEVAEAAADGMLWGLSPFELITLVHAVNRPVEIPRAVKILPVRGEGSTSATLAGAVDLHGPSTGTLSAEATWEEPIDDPTLPVCYTHKGGALAFQTIIQQSEDIALLGDRDTVLNLPDIGPINVHRAVHEFSDTRHRLVDYRFRAFTRFKEIFNPKLLLNKEGQASDDMHSVVGPLVRISIPSSARPAPPVVNSVLPLFRWSDETEPEQPMARRRTRRAGLRIYLERPWFSSGEGELLGLLIASTGDDTVYPPVDDQSGFPFVSKWGADPIWHAREVDRRALPMLRLDDLLRLAALDDRNEAARPVVPPRQLPLTTVAERPSVTVLGYQPEYNHERQLWFVDVAIDPGPQFWPFVRLAVSRYQPDSIDGCHLSQPVQCDFVQLPPERTASISRTDDQHVRVLVSGPVGTRPQSSRFNRRESAAETIGHNRKLVARLQRRDPEIGSDLGWETLAAEKLSLRGLSGDGFTATWLAEIGAGITIPLLQPGNEPSAWRVTVEEWEMIEADDLQLSLKGRRMQVPRMERRLVYADSLAL